MFAFDMKPPKYRQLEKYLKNKILSGAFRPGTRVPSEHQLIREFGLSNTTVQKAITTLVHEGYLIRHQGKGTFVSPSVKDKLRKGVRKKTFCLVTDSGGLEKAVSTTLQCFKYFDAIRGVFEAVCDADCLLTMTSIPDEESAENEAMRIIESGGARGALVIGGDVHPEVLTILKREKFPFAVIGFSADEIRRDLPNVFVWDTYQGTYDLASYLLKTGYRRIGTLGYSPVPGRPSMKEKALMDALSAAEVPYREEYRLECGPSNFGAFVAVHGLVESGDLPEAILAGSDEMAFGAMSALMEKGLRIPEDIAVIGFGNVPEAALTSPALTTVREPRYEIGRAAFEKLLECSDKGVYDFEPVVLPVEKVIRQTCRVPSRNYL